MINEISSASTPEWVELYAPAVTSLAGWIVQFDANDGTTQKKTLTATDATDSNGLFVVEPAGSWLANSGDTVKLYDGATLKQTVAVPNMTAAQSYRADYDGAATFALTNTPTRGTTNGAAPALTLAQRVAAAAPGDTIDVTSDEVISSQIVINKPLTIKSSNGAKLSTPNALSGILGIQSANVTIDGLTFESNFDIGEPQVVRGLEVSSYGGIVIKNNRFLHLRQPAYINDNAQVTVTGNYTNQTKGWVILSNSNVAFSGNTWGTNVLDIAVIAGATNNYSDAQIISMSDTNSDAVVETQFGGTNRLSDAYVTQVSNGNSGDEGSMWNPYTSIQNGVDRVVTGGTVHVANGTYTQSTNVNKMATMKAQSQNVRVIGGPSYNDAAFRVTAPNVTIDGFSIGHPSSMIATVGIELGNSAGAVITNNLIERNQRGISLSGASHVTIDSTTVRDNNADPENNAGIWGDAINGIMISNSTFSGASNTSINLADSQHIAIKNNTFTSGANAAVIWNDSDVTLENNSLSGLSSTGFFITGTNGLIATKNTLAATSTGKSGFSVSTASGNQSFHITLLHNSITGYTNGLTVGTGAAVLPVLATENWWGNASGPKDVVSTDNSTPAVNISGTGVTVNGAANYRSWCLSVACDSFFSLAAPTGLTPATGTITKDRNFAMTWQTVPGAAVYEYRTANTLVDATTLGPIVYSDNSSSSNYTLGNATVTRGNSGTPDADYYWQVRAGDGSGTWSPWSQIQKVTVDNVAPTITVKSGAIGTPSSKTFSSVSFSLYDAHQVDKYVLNGQTVDFTNNTYSDANFQNIAPKLVQGTNTFVLYDVAGNTTTYTFMYDTTAPVLTAKNATWNDSSVAPIASGSVVSTQQLSELRLFAADANIAKITMDGATQWEGGWIAASGGVGISYLTSGTHTFQAVDLAGNVSNTITLTFDNVAPTPRVTATSYDAATKQLTVSGDTSDSADEVTVQYGNVLYPVSVNSDKTWTVTIATATSPNGQTVTASARDAAGNSSSSMPYTVTITPPAESSTTTSGGQSSGSQQPSSTTAQRAVVASPPTVLGIALPVLIASATTPTVATTLPTGNVAVDSAEQGTVLGSETTRSAAQSSNDESNVKGATDEKTGANWFAANWSWLLLLVAAIGATWWFLAVRRRSAENA